MIQRLLRSLRWRLGLAGGRPERGERLVQVAPMLNCPLWGVTTPDQCEGCPYFQGSCLPAPNSPMQTISMVKCSFNGSVTSQERLVLSRMTRERGLEQEIYRCVSCGNPFVDHEGVDVPTCPRFLCQARVLMVGRGATREPGRGKMRVGSQPQDSSETGLHEGIEPGGDDAEEHGFRQRRPNPSGGKAPGA